MKTTNATTYRTLLQNLTRGSTRLNDWRIKTATGKQVSRPSDDPTAIRPILNARSQISASDRYVRTMDTAQDRLDNSEAYLFNVENVLTRVKELVIQAGNATYTPEDRALLANEIALRREELLDAANAKVDGKYLFAGYADNTKPFLANPAYPGTSSAPVIYAGDSRAVTLEIGPGALVETSIPGSELFMGQEDTDGDGVAEQVGIDIFSVLARIEEGLRANDPDAVNVEIDNVEEGANQVRKLHGLLGAVGQRLDTARVHMETLNIDMEEIRSRYEDIDLVEAISNMTMEENALKAAMQVSARVSQLSILDYF
ncbi:flagellar hook-associated protein FlgL [Desulfuromonas sp. AOP6]|uniref:flagellar hook-associated protein FlgL n=1 Tax=Desulfuromonas sp. AOP6 TaxID=1566351 RepID=UPI00127597EC|nr:flagellar hook-associated protein FlgL [Desulfuromonas sp. AOP6]BCA79141.1 flagellar hook-associated protein FlgL [Desulfuromonas sp. AOP6]